MANENETKAPETPDLYVLHNVSRDVETKFQRFAEPQTGRRRMVFLPDGERLLKGRPKAVAVAWVEKNKEPVLELIRQGRIEVRTVTGEKVDLGTGAVAPAPASPPAPRPPLDSAANDKPAGERMPQMPGGMALADFTAMGGTGATASIPGPKEDKKGHFWDKKSKGKKPEEKAPEGDTESEEVTFDEAKERK